MKRLYKNYLEEYKTGLIGYATIAILGQSCLGSIAVMYLLQTGTTSFQMIQLFFVTVFCLFYNGAIISQQKPRLSFNLLIISVLVSFLVICVN